MFKFLIVVAFTLISAVTTAAELTLFDIPLRTASRQDIGNAITKAGGKLRSSSRDADQYDASAIGLPGATSLEVIYLQNKLVMAQYSLSKGDLELDERIRKMLVAKYGQPQGEHDFDREYIGDGKYRWRFDNSMELVFTKEFFGSRYLSYVNKPEEARLGALVKEADNQAAAKEAAAKSSVF